MKKKREDLKADECLCDFCPAKCCHYFALPIETPEDREALDNIRWYMLHEHVSIFVDEGDWFLMVLTKCTKLRDDNLCGIYDIRPEICREYSTDNCEYDGDGCYDQLFETPEQMLEYMDALYPVRTKKKKNKKNLTELPIVV